MSRSELADEGYSLRDVGRLLGLSRSIVTGLIEAGFVSPTRGRRREYRFTFRDLVVLRAAQGLSQANLTPSRILRSLRRLRTQLPERIPMSGLRVEAVGDAVVVREGANQWQPDDGQYVLQFHVETDGAQLTFEEAPGATAEARPSNDGTAWFDRGCALEPGNPDAARDAYRRAIEADASHVGAYTNLGRLLHEAGKLDEADTVYQQGLANCGDDPLLLFNHAVLLEDMRKPDEAAAAYRAALEIDPDLADAHYNLSLLCQTKGLRQEALRHMSAFRRLTRG